MEVNFCGYRNLFGKCNLECEDPKIFDSIKSTILDFLSKFPKESEREKFAKNQIQDCQNEMCAKLGKTSN